MIKINFYSVNQKIQNYSILCRKNEKFAIIEQNLYEAYPEFIETENYFLLGGKKINRNKTLAQNNINHNDNILLEIYD